MLYHGLFPEKQVIFDEADGEECLPSMASRTEMTSSRDELNALRGLHISLKDIR
jgi:hypothetical protein